MKRTILYPLLTPHLSIFSDGQAIVSGSDSTRLSLLTCAPGGEVYSLFGHTVTRYEDPANRVGAVFNYGLFSFDTPNFILRFSPDRTDYRLRAIDYARLAAEYAFNGCSVWQQALNLSKEGKAELIRLLQKNYPPENKVYRCNFFYDNCAARPRDKMEESTDGKVIYPVEPQDGSLSSRGIVRQYCKGHPWARFGIDLCIGSEADHPITQRQVMFTPFCLTDVFTSAQIVRDSVRRLLVSGKELIVDALPEEEEGDWMPTPFQCSLPLFILTVAATTYSTRKRTGLWGVDLTLLGTADTVGCALAFLTLFPEYPAVSSDFLLLVFHPGQLLLLPYIICCVRKGKKCWYLTLNLVVLTLFVALFPLIPQRFDLTVIPSALCLLIHSVSNLILTSKKK